MQTNRNLWPLGIFTAFGLFFVGMASVVVIASTHREHLVKADYYEQELKFQAQIDSVDRAKKSGAAIAFAASTGAVTIAVPLSHLAQNFSGTIQLYRPSEPGLDRELRLEPQSDGTQAINVSKLASGLWIVRLKWMAANQSFFLEQKIAVAGR
ncbi:MAG: FixH family protein [Verrucomicrobiae bacterium]